ncbi:hypothetical protein GQ457_07G007250 [Hibiscus cannabinus]
MLSIFIIFILLVVHIRNMDASSENDDNGPNGPVASASDGHEGVRFGWTDEIVDEDSYEAHEDSGESDWLGRNELLSDDDEEVNAIGAHFRVVKKKIRNKTMQAEHLEPPLNLSFVVENDIDARNAEVENEANRNRPAESGVNEKEAAGNGENETDGAGENDTEENEVSSVGLSTGEETDYLGSSDVGSYETDEDGDFVSRKTSKIRIVPKLRLVDMIRLGREELNVELNKQLCSRAKKWAEEKIKGNIIHEFNRLFDYVLALRTADPDGSFDLVVERPTAVDIPKFRRLYVCFGALKEGFKRYCRHVIGVDGYFLKGSLKGEILSAVGRDSNNQIFPIAWAFVEVENRETWAWFLNHLQNDLNLGNGDNLTLLSDMQKGLLEEVQQCLPHVEHRYCARYMYANWKKDHKGGDLQLLFWNCCKATTQPLFRKHADIICKLKPKAYADLMEKDPSHWSKAFFSTRSKCDAIDNNFCEAFNYAIIGARFKSIISMFEDIRHYVMHRLVEHKKKSISWIGEFCPRIAKILEEHKARSSFCHVIWNGADGYEVMHNEENFVVDVRGWKCTCKVWDLTGIPCPHAVCVILYREESLENYVLHLYKKEVYQELYSVFIPTIPSEKYWQDSGMGKIDPPLKRKMPGRPKHKRRKEEGEVKGKTKLRKLGAKISCRCCGLTGHNIRTCPKKQQANVQNHANQPPPMATHPGPSSSIPSDPAPLIGPFSPPHSIRQSDPQPSTGPSSPPHSTLPSAPQPSTGPSSPPHSNIPSAPPMVFMPTPYVQPSLASDATSPPVTRITTFSPKRKVTANRMPLYRRSREHATPSTIFIPPVSSQPTATVNVPQEGKGRPPKLTIWKP